MSTSALNSTPQDSATIIIVRQDREKSLEVFLARRHVSQSFMAGAFVFPGGKLEAADTDCTLTKFISGNDYFQPQALLQDDTLTRETALSFFICAIRETFEETGVLFAHTAKGRPLDFNNENIKSRFAAYRLSLNLGSITLAEIVRQEELTLMPTFLIPYSHWITPEIIPKRFSTRFFLGKLPQGQSAATDNDELTSSLWVTPHQALQMNASGEIVLMPPTLKTIVEMATFISVDDLFTAAVNSRIYPIMPQPMKNGLMLPHDPEYNIEHYKQPVKPGEHSRLLFADGKWQCAEFPEKARV